VEWDSIGVQKVIGSEIGGEKKSASHGGGSVSASAYLFKEEKARYKEEGKDDISRSMLGRCKT